MPKKILSVLKKQGKGKGGEIHITDAIKTLIKKNEKFYGNIFRGNILTAVHSKVLLILVLLFLNTYKKFI